MTIQNKTNYNYLFSNLSSSSSSGSSSSNFLIDYASIKNGSYGKLMKAYYAKNPDSTGVLDTNSNTNTKNLMIIQSDATDLQKSISDVASNVEKDMNIDKAYESVSKFVTDYNDFLKSAGNSNDTSILRTTLNLANAVQKSSSLLSNVGITIGSDNTLSINEDTFKNANQSTIQSLFSGNSSLGTSISSKVSIIGIQASNEAKRSSLYTNVGDYTSAFSSGTILNRFI
ncbi:MAG: hypothetical protein ACRC7V_03295 [Lachnospiraceae bacterium]